jgi:hypothetical protein
MGDHLPGFIAMSFDERRGGPPRDFTEDETPEDEAAVETEAEAPLEVEAQEEAPKPKRRRSRSKKADAPEATDAQAVSEADAPDAASTDSAETAA